jgi:FkbM family methyltransferase
MIRLLQIVYRRLARMPLKRLSQLPLLRPLAARFGKVAHSQDFTADVLGVRLTMPGLFIDYYTDRFEPSTLQWLTANLRPGMKVADVGAHVGFLALFMARLVGERGRVYVFEPGPDNLRYLRRNIAQNGATNVAVVPLAAGSCKGTRSLYLAEGSDMHSLFPGHPFSKTTGSVEIGQVPLADAVRRLDLAKVDVEGGEIDVLRGMGNLLRQEPRPILLIEWSPACQVAAGHSPEELIRVLRDLGYELQILGDPNGQRRSVDVLLRLLNDGKIAKNWYANLLCLPQTATGWAEARSLPSGDAR